MSSKVPFCYCQFVHKHWVQSPREDDTKWAYPLLLPQMELFSSFYHRFDFFALHFFSFLFFSLILFFVLPLFLFVVDDHFSLFTTTTFYTVCHDKIYNFLFLNCFWLVVGVLPRLATSLLVAQPLLLHCVGCITLHSQKKMAWFVSYLSLFSLLLSG